MKKLILIIFLIYTSTFVNCQTFEKRVIDKDTCSILPYGQEYYYYNNDNISRKKDSLSDGLWAEIKDNKVIYKFNIKNNKLHGEWTGYNSKEIISDQGKYFEGKKAGTFFKFDSTGFPIPSGYWQNDIEEEAYYYFPNGQVSSRSITIPSKDQYSLLLFTEYYENGMKKAEGINKFKGYCTEKGDLSGDLVYCKHGKWCYYYSNGNYKLICEFNFDIKVGSWKYYNENGLLEKTEEYKNGKLKEALEFDYFQKNGRLIMVDKKK